MKTASVLLVLSAAVAIPTPCSADEGFVGLYADPEATQSDIEIPQGESRRIFVVATTGDATADGFTGAEFRIEVSNPDGYFFVYHPPLEAIVIGSPFDLEPDNPWNPAGVNVAFGECQTITGTAPDRVPLGSITVLNNGGGPTLLLVKARDEPTHPLFSCPLFTLCDPPVFSKSCMKQVAFDGAEEVSFRASLNGAIQPTEESRIGLYFDRAGTTCSKTVEAPLDTLYVMARVGPSEFSMARFRIDGLPSGWFADATFNRDSPSGWAVCSRAASRSPCRHLVSSPT